MHLGNGLAYFYPATLSVLIQISRKVAVAYRANSIIFAEYMTTLPWNTYMMHLILLDLQWTLVQ